ncbi:Predicted oxidoreductase [Lentzea xinjiangensis]|uniref:Predicted oxidoreductase n=1 Tax=Lentzea xinjiangensis TaxID=402600 RepID=A0A1H9R992_9PSEU|nr:aldo/keto reductase [Lentzea xinjiangensis]SER69314.1 Predicted oxidoreductase [Lentzea xinjiangensis]
MAQLALGLASLGRPAYINLGREDALPRVRDVDAMRAQCHLVLDTAYELGIRWVDAARSYGLSEDFLSSWLPGHDDVTISSKWGYAYTADWRPDAEVHEVKEHSLARFAQQWRETSALLPRVDLYQVHSLTADSPLFEDAALRDAMTGIGVPLGFSTSGPRQADTIRKALDLGVFQSVQSTWNLLETSAGDALREAHDAGLRVIVKEGVANGRLVVDPPPAVAARAEALGVGPDAVALAAIVRQPWADVVLSGAASPEQLRSNVDALRIDVDLPELAEPAEQYWRTRAGLSWN